uniref:Uncharacterized protein n=1 Tax=Rhizophora mucronata TaxID=61149 RepID=A0A2P2PLN0_RHIMU
MAGSSPVPNKIRTPLCPNSYQSFFLI